MKSFMSYLTLVSVVLLPIRLFSADVSFYGVTKDQSFIQNNPVAPMLKDKHNSTGTNGGPLRFNAFVEMTASNAVTNAQITIPVIPAVSPTLSLSSDGLSKNIEAAFESKAELDAQYTNGIYYVTMQGINDGTKVIALNLTTDNYPPVPRVSNYDFAQNVAGNSFTLTWDAAGAGVGYVEVRVEEQTFNGSTKIYQSPDFGTPGALDGNSTSVLITNLSPGKVYSATLMFANAVVDSTSYGSGVAGVAAFTKETEFTLRTTGTISDTTPPNFQGSTPWNGSTNVALNSVIAFHFSEPMQPGYSIAWAPTEIQNNFSYTWSADAMTLFCKYSGSLPANTSISWTLNASSFHDLAGNMLGTSPMMPLMGSFNTGSQTPALDVEEVVLIKGRGAFTTDGTPVDYGMFVAGFDSSLTGFNTVTNVTLTIPGVGDVSFGPDKYDGDTVQVEAEYASQSDLDRFFPDGTYTVNLNTVHDGTKSVSVTLTGSDYPNFPTFGNFSSTQSVNPSNDFTLSWSAFIGGTTGDFIEVEVENQYGQEVYRSPDPGEGSLNGTSTQVVIPANTLAPGRTYDATVRFIKIKHFESSAAGYAGVRAVAVYASETEFKLTTTGQVIQPRFSVLPLNNGNFQGRLTGERGVPYTIEATEDFMNWYVYLTQNAYSNPNGMEASIDFTDGSSSFNSHRFYRAKEGFIQQGPN